jgi:hypothetical protein
MDLSGIKKNSLDNSQKNIIKNSSSINNSLDETITNNNQLLMKKNKINNEQEKAIQDKQKILLTRARMLQLSRDKNAYKLKIIYTLIAIILVIFTIVLFIYSFYKKQM